MMDFELFDTVSSHSDMAMSNCGVSGLISADDGSSQPDSIMLSLNEHLLSSFGNNKPLTSSPSSSSPADCFYFIPELNSACTLVNPNDMRDEEIDSKLFLKNEEDGIWVFADKEVENMETTPRINTAKNYLETPAAKSQFRTGHVTQPRLLSYKRSSQKQEDTSPPEKNDKHHEPSTTRKRKLGMTSSSSRSSENEKSLWDEFKFSKTSVKSNGIKNVTTVPTNKVTNSSPVLTEEFLKTWTDSITQQISSTVRQEVCLAMDGFKTYLDEKFQQAANMLAQPSCHPRDNEESPSDHNTRNLNPQQTVQDSFGINSCSAADQDQESHIYGSESYNMQYGEMCPNIIDSDTSEKIHETKKIKAYHTSQVELVELEPQSRSVDVSRPTATLGLQMETPKKTNEPCSSIHDDNNLNLADLLNVSSFTPRESDHTFTFVKKNIKKEPLPTTVEDEVSQTENNLDLFKTEDDINQLFEQEESKIKLEKQDENATLDGPCTALVPYIPPSSTKSDAITPRKREQALKPELALRKYRKPLICDVCNRAFLNNSSLRQHMSFHKPQRPYLCSQAGCQKSYKTRSELNRHLIVHSGEKNYECRKCGKSFLRKQYLKTHLIRHNEGLTWQCTLCAKIFVSEEDLSKHKVSYHKSGKRSSLLMIAQPQKLAITYHLEDSLEA